MTDRIDKEDNIIGDGSIHADYFIEDISGVSSKVVFSESTESVYIYYQLGERKVSVRFSNHINNAVKFGDQLNGAICTRNDILFRLGLVKCLFIPRKRKYIYTRQVKKKEIVNYEMINLTISELYKLPAGSDLSQYKGKIAKNSNYLILGDTIEEWLETRINVSGVEVTVGDYIYLQPLKLNLDILKNVKQIINKKN